MRIKVLGPEGKPLEKAKVEVSVWTKDPFQHNRHYVCDAEGRVTVELPQTIDILRLWFKYPKHVPLFAHWERAETGEIPGDYEVRLKKGTVIGGVVTNEDGKPIEGVVVQVALATNNSLEQREILRPDKWLALGIDARVTNGEGRWKLENVPPGDDVSVDLMLSHRQYASDYEWGNSQKKQQVTMESLRDQTATIVMHGGVVVSGTITDATGKPVPKALVVWGDDPYRQEGRQEVLTDSKGAYRFPPLAIGPLTVTVMAEGWAPELKKIDVLRENSSVDFQLARGAKMRFVFVDRNGKPIPEVAVSIAEWRGGKSLYNHKHPNVIDSKIPNHADKDGVYEWTWAPRDDVTYHFYTQNPGFPGDRVFYADDQEHVITLP